MTHLLTRRRTLALGLALLTPPALAWGQEIHDVAEMSLGSPDAPVTMVEYASFTCPHCAAFNAEVMPQVKANFVETGKVRLVFREVYFDKAGLWSSMIARCAPKDRFFGLVDVLFERQMDWAVSATAEEMMQKLYAIGRQAGLTDAEMDACMADQAYAEALVEAYQANSERDKIDSTPSFLINGEKLGNMSYPEIAAKLEAAAD